METYKIKIFPTAKQDLEEVIGYTEKLRPDAVVIAGDIYDKSVPSAEAVAVFDDFLTRLSSVSLRCRF